MQMKMHQRNKYKENGILNVNPADYHASKSAGWCFDDGNSFAPLVTPSITKDHGTVLVWELIVDESNLATVNSVSDFPARWQTHLVKQS